jgi:hypothetical protein
MHKEHNFRTLLFTGTIVTLLLIGCSGSGGSDIVETQKQSTGTGAEIVKGLYFFYRRFIR